MLRETFRRQHRMPNASAFSSVFEKAAWKSGSADLLFLARPNGLKTARLGLVISKKNQPLSVHRNRTKRILREAFRHHRQVLSPIDIIILSRSGIRAMNSDTLRESAIKHLTRIQKLSEAPLAL